MPIFYSASRAGFFDPAVHRDMPGDANRISARLHSTLIAGEAAGARIVHDAKGQPALAWPSASEQRSALIARVKKEAARRINAISPVWRQVNDLRLPSTAATTRFERIDAIRAASGAIEAEIARASDADLDSISISDHLLWGSHP